MATPPRTLPMLRALAASPSGMTTPELARLISDSASSWINALGITRQLMLKQEKRGRVERVGTVPGDRTRGSWLWWITEAGERYLADLDAAGAGPVPAARIAIDLNVRLGKDLTYSGFDDVEGAAAADLEPGTAVEVFERETGVHGPAEIAHLDVARELVYVRLNWARLAA